jgi:hypothetical protein
MLPKHKGEFNMNNASDLTKFALGCAAASVGAVITDYWLYKGNDEIKPSVSRSFIVAGKCAAAFAIALGSLILMKSAADPNTFSNDFYENKDIKTALGGFSSLTGGKLLFDIFNTFSDNKESVKIDL